MFVGLLAAVCIASLVGTGMLRRYAIARSVLDVPNARSSHTVPTPRGGGVAIVGAFLVAALWLAAASWIHTRTAIAVLGSGLLVAGVGFVDDHRHVPPRWRLAVHFAAAAWGLAWLGGPWLAASLGLAPAFDVVVHAVVAVGLVWLLNLYNFMDGIDGIAGVEALTALAGAVVILAAQGSATQEWALPAALGAASLGFLVWNFPPARIFMGDAGSGFVGLMLGLLAVHTSRNMPVLLWSWAILLGVFVVDATVTLVVRWHRGDRVSEAHRSHAYQHAAVRAGAHRPVTIAVALINGLWLFPIAWFVARGHVGGSVGLAIAYLPLIVLAFRLNAGQPNPGR